MVKKKNIDAIIQETKNWVSDFIIAYNICPFAKREFINDRIAYRVVFDAPIEEQLYQLISNCHELDNHPGLETSLLIFPDSFKLFDDYLDFLELSNQLLQRQGFEGIYQLASFHPDYCFEGIDEEDASNYTNRSPYPMLHLIREKSLDKALKRYPDPENIPLRNIKKTQEIGSLKLQEILRNCKVQP